MTYQLIAVDMDGTLLNRDFHISKECQSAIEKATTMGKYVVISTGRSLTEMKPYLNDLKGMRYLILESGAVVYDLYKNKILFQKTFKKEEVEAIYRIYLKQDMMIHIFTNGYSYALKNNMLEMEKCQMGKYQPTFIQNNSGIDDVNSFLNDHINSIEKINLYHRSPKDREFSIKALEDLPVSQACVEISSLELSPQGVDKGVGLTYLCQELDIPICQSIAIGDSHNDYGMMKTAGLAIAMGNAIDEIKEIADVEVEDCHHHGVAEAIEKYLI